MFKKISLLTLLSIASLSNAGIWDRVAKAATRTAVAFRNVAVKPSNTQIALAYIAQPRLGVIQTARVALKNQAARITPAQELTFKTVAGLGLASIASFETSKLVERAGFTKNGGVIISQANLAEASVAVEPTVEAVVAEAPVAEPVVAQEATVAVEPAVEPVTTEEAPVAKVSRIESALKAAESIGTSAINAEERVKNWTNDTKAAQVIRNATYATGRGISYVGKGAYNLATDNRLVNWFRSKKSN